MPEPAVSLTHITKRFRTADAPAHTAEPPGKSGCAGDTRERDGFFYALDDVSLSVAEGEFAVIGGANGSGKSLLMAIIAGLTAPSSGSCEGTPRTGIVFQDADSQILGETPREDTALGPKNLKLPKADIDRLVAESLAAVGLSDKADFPARALSGGEKRRLSLAGILAMNPRLFIFDEPYANLDYAGVKDVNSALKNLKSQKKTVIVLTHELEKCLALADRFLVLFEGRLVFDGTPRDCTAPERAGQLETWGIRYPLVHYKNPEDLVWL